MLKPENEKGHQHIGPEHQKGYRHSSLHCQPGFKGHIHNKRALIALKAYLGGIEKPTNRYWVLLSRDGNKCYICSKPFTLSKPPTMEHIVPRKLGGQLTPENSKLAHSLCNGHKGDSIIESELDKFTLAAIIGAPSKRDRQRLRRKYKLMEQPWLDYLPFIREQ